MEYRFRAKKYWNLPINVSRIILLGVLIGNFFPKYIVHPWINISILILGFIFLVFCFRELSQKIILTISDTGISYSGHDYIFAPKLENIKSEQLSKILIPDNEWLSFIERKLKLTICLMDHQRNLIKNLDGQQWQSLDDLDLEQALDSCFNDKIELTRRSKILEIMIKHQKNAMELGKVAGYFAYASVGLTVLCVGLVFLDSNATTIDWGQYKSLIWMLALIIAVICLVVLVRAQTHITALFVVPLLFTTAMTFSIHQSFMLLNYHLGQQKNYTFEKVIQNKNSEVWRTAVGEKVECKPSPRKLHDYQTAIVHVGMLGVVRIGANEVCMSPQEIK